MAKRKPSTSSRRPPSRGVADDAFTANILQFLGWARNKTQVLVIAGIALVVLLVGSVYWFQQRGERLVQAANELENLHGVAMFGDPAQAQVQLNEYLERFGGTPYAIEARLILAELHLEHGRPESAISVLEPVAPSYRTPLTVQATFLMAVAMEEDARWADAVSLYAEIRDRVELTFQKREAAEGLVRAQLVQGDTVGAIQTYEWLLETLDEDHPRRPRFERRLAELSAASDNL